MRHDGAGPRRSARTAAAGLLVLTLALTACTGGSSAPSADRPDGADPSATSSASATADRVRAPVARAPFCDALDTDAAAALLREVLGGDPVATDGYVPGERVRLEPGLEDVAEEFGCVYAGNGVRARAWVFALPLTPGRARALAAQTVDQPGGERCRRSGEPFGRPGAVAVCPSAVVMSGLFADSWVHCEARVPGRAGRRPDPAAVGRWCEAVLAATAPRT